MSTSQEVWKRIDTWELGRNGDSDLKAIDVGVGADNTPWVISTDESSVYGNRVMRFAAEAWSEVPGLHWPTRITVDQWGQGWVVTITGDVFRFDGIEWVPQFGNAVDVGVGTTTDKDSSIWILNAYGEAIEITECERIWPTSAELCGGGGPSNCSAALGPIKRGVELSPELAGKTCARSDFCGDDQWSTSLVRRHG